MGKRQVRISRKDILLKKAELEGVTGHVIMADHVVHNGQILAVSDSQLELRDPRFNKHKLEMGAILEIVYDKETDY
ncbi:MAG: hypothetical protein ACO1OF_12120 [Adhaeribacter sp.]